jgi:vacuolar-type H+-ATPase subunit I/STV1
MEERVNIMNMKWMSLVAVMTVVSVGCSDSEQESTNKVGSDSIPAVVEVEVVEFKELKGAIHREQTPEQKVAIKEALSSVEGLPPEKLDSEVKGLVAKISENSDMSEEEAAKLEQDLKSVFQKIEADRVQ